MPRPAKNVERIPDFCKYIKGYIQCRIQGVRGDIEPYFPLQPFILFAHYSYSTEHENEL